MRDKSMCLFCQETFFFFSGRAKGFMKKSCFLYIFMSSGGQPLLRTCTNRRMMNSKNPQEHLKLALFATHEVFCTFQ
jgi:hypothetical protein